MRVVLVTQGDPIFIPLYINEITKRSAHICAVIQLPSFSSKIKMIQRTLSFLGVFGFAIVGFKVVLIKLLNILSSFGLCHRPVLEHILRQADIPLLKFGKINSQEALAALKNLKPDIIFSLAAPQKFNQELLSIPRWGCFNIHSSLLPSYKGQLALFWALLNRENSIGFTIHKMGEEFDNGPIARQVRLPVYKGMSFEKASLKVIAAAAPEIASFFKEIETTQGHPNLTPMPNGGQFCRYPTRQDRIAFLKTGHKLFHLLPPKLAVEKKLAVTIDLEADYAGMKPKNTYYSCDESKLSDFFAVLEKYKAPVTVFVVGELLDMRHPIVEVFRKRGSEFELHSYSHKIFDADIPYEISEGKKAFIRYFGRDPMGYRTPQGRISDSDFEVLEKNNFLYDSSVFPSFWPEFRFLRAPRVPNQPERRKILEIPFATLPWIRIIVSHSWIKLLGWNIWRVLLFLFPLPSVLVFDCHLHDFVCPPECNEELSFFWKRVFMRNRKTTHILLDSFMKFAVEDGYRLVSMSEIYVDHRRT